MTAPKEIVAEHGEEQSKLCVLFVFLVVADCKVLLKSNVQIFEASFFFRWRCC